MMSAKSDSPTVVAIGEVLWDVFPDGPRFGGAPANFICQTAMLGSRALMYSAVGADPLGVQAVEFLQRQRVNTDYVQADPHPTGTVQVTVDGHGKADYVFQSDCAWDHLAFAAKHHALALSADAVCFGTLGQRSDQSRCTIQEFVRATRPECLRVFDVNLRQKFFNVDILRESLQLANVFKLSDDEVSTVALLLDLPADDEERFCRACLEQFGLQLVALTRGAQGAQLVTHDQTITQPGIPAQVIDTVGAGDAFTAALVWGVLRQKPWERLLESACRLAANVCSQAGAVPPLDSSMRALFE